MVEYENSSGLGATRASARSRGSARAESRVSGKASRVARAALTAALLSSTALIGATAVASAQAVWGGATDVDWNVNTNWVGGNPPVAGDNVVIPGVDGGVPAFNPTFNGAGAGAAPGAAIGTLTVEGAAPSYNGSLTISGGTLHAGAVTLQDGGVAGGAGIIAIGSAAGGLSATTLNIASGAASSFTVTKGSATFSAGATVAAGVLVLNGAGADLATFNAASLNVSGGSVGIQSAGALLTVGGLNVTGGGFIVNTTADAAANAGILVNGDATLGGAGTTAVSTGLYNVTGAATVQAGHTVNVGGAAQTAAFTVGSTLLIDGANSVVKADTKGSVNVTGLTTVKTNDASKGLQITTGAVNAAGGLKLEGGRADVAGNGFLNVTGNLETTGASRLAVNTGAAAVAGKGVAVSGNATLDGAGTTTLERGLFDIKGNTEVKGGHTVSVIVAAAGDDKLVLGTDATNTLKVEGANSKIEVTSAGGLVIANAATTIGAAGAATPDGTLVVGGVGGKFDAIGGLTINNHGTVNIGNNGQITVGAAAAAKDLTVAAGGSLNVNAAAKADPALSVVGNLVINGADGNSPVALSKGTVDVVGTATVAGRTVTVGEAVLAVKATAAADAGTGALTVSGKGDVQLTNTASELKVATVALADATSTLTYAAAPAADPTYVITGAGGVKISNATVELKGANTFAGGVTLESNGVLAIKSVNTLGTANAEGNRVVKFDDGTAQFAATIENDAGVAFQRTANGKTISVESLANTFAVNQVLTGVGNVTVKAPTAGTIKLAGTNTFTGEVNVAQGTLEISQLDNLGTGYKSGTTPADPWVRKVNFGNNTTLALAGTAIADDTNLELAGGANNYALSVGENNTFTVNQALAGTGTLEKKGAGKLVLATTTGNANTALKVSGGTVSATNKNQLGNTGGLGLGVTLAGGYLNVGKAAGADAVGIADSTDLNIVFDKGAAGATLTSGFDIDANKTFTLNSNVTAGAGAGTITLAKKGEGRLVLAGAGIGAQANNIIEAGTLSVTTLGNLGGAGAKATFAGGALGIGDGVAAALLTNDNNLNLLWGEANAAKNATIDVAKESTFAIENNAFGQYNTYDPVTGLPLPAKSTVTGALIKKGEGTLVLSNADINYTGGTVVEAGTLKVDAAADKFRFKDGKYTVNGGTLEANISNLTVTELAGSGKTTVVTPATATDPAVYGIDAGTIQIAAGTTGAALGNTEMTLTVKETTGEGGFWGRILGFFAEDPADKAANPRTRAGTLVADAGAGKEVVLTGNTSEVKTVNVSGGTLRVNNGSLPIAADSATTTEHKGRLLADAVNVNGTATNRAALAGSGTVEAATVTIKEHGALRGDRDGTLTIKGDVTFENGATIELGRFLGHKVADANNVTNQYFHVDGTVTAAAALTTVNLNNDGIDPGVYRVISSTNAINGGFQVGTIADLPAGSISVALTGEGKFLDLTSTTGRADLRYWNGQPNAAGVSTWAVNGTEWTGSNKENAGALHLAGVESVVGVFGYNGTAGFPQSGTVNVAGNNQLTQGLQFFAGDWTLTGDQLELKGGATGTTYAGITSIDAGAGAIAIGNQLTGSAALRKTGTGSLTLSGVNTYAGGTIVESGTLSITSDANLGAANGGITLNGAGSTLALASGFGQTARNIVVNLPANAGSVNAVSTIDLGGAQVGPQGVRFGGTLTGNGALALQKGGAIFTAQNGVNFGGSVHVGADAGLAVEKGGSINTLSVDGTLWGTFGHTLVVDNLNLASTAKIWLELDNASSVTTAFKGTNAVLGGEIATLDLPDNFAVGSNGTSLYVFDYVNRTGEVTISDAVKAKYANSNFDFAGFANGYLVLNAKTGPVPQPGAGESVNVDNLRTLQNWSETTFVDGQSWNNGVATFSGAGASKPVNVEGNVRIAGLTINGQNFLFKDAAVAGKPGAFYLQAAAGNATVDFTVAKDGSATIAVPLGGPSDFAKKGAGHLELSGNSSGYTGTGKVQDGTLYVAGNFSSGSFEVTGGLLRVNGVAKNVTVGPNGTLQGLGSGNGVNIGTLVVNGGTVQPGNSVGTLYVGGATFNGGTIEFEAGDSITALAGFGGVPDGRIDFNRDANGKAVNVVLVNSGSAYTFGRGYQILTAANGVTGLGAVSVSEKSTQRLFSFFNVRTTATGAEVYLQRDTSRSFATQATTRNQAAVANALESLTAGNLAASRGAVYDAIAAATNDQAALVRVAFDQLSGEVHSSAKGVLIDESRHLREATANRTRAALSGAATDAPGQVVQAPAGSNIALWGQAYGSWGETDSTANTAKLDRSTGGFVLGFDTGIADNWRLGIAGGYAKSDIESKSNLSKADVDNYNLAIYGGGQFGDLGLRFGLGHTWHRLDTERQLNVLGLQSTNRAKYDARTLQLYAEAGYEVKFETASIEPFLNLAYVSHHSDNFTERGTGHDSALHGRSRTEGTGFSTLGLRLSKYFDLSGAKGTATGTLGWRHAFGDVDPRTVLSGNGTQLFTITGAPIAKNAFVLGVGLDFEIAHGTTLGVSYNGQLGDHTQDHGVKGNFSVRF